MNKVDYTQTSLKFLDLFQELRRKGYVNTFFRDPSRLYCIEAQRWILPSEFDVDESYYFTTGIAMDTDRQVYAISTTHQLKGVLIDASGVYKDNIGAELTRKLESSG
jgi:hypothetical protein